MVGVEAGVPRARPHRGSPTGAAPGELAPPMRAGRSVLARAKAFDELVAAQAGFRSVSLPDGLVGRLGVDALTVTPPDGNACDAWAVTDPHWATDLEARHGDRRCAVGRLRRSGRRGPAQDDHGDLPIAGAGLAARSRSLPR
jgi:hypothetical protein